VRDKRCRLENYTSGIWSRGSGPVIISARPGSLPAHPSPIGTVPVRVSDLLRGRLHQKLPPEGQGWVRAQGILTSDTAIRTKKVRSN